MKAIQVHETGAADVLRLEQVPDPRPGPGEALVRVEAIGINFIEVYQRTGLYPMPKPFTPGTEGAGTVSGRRRWSDFGPDRRARGIGFTEGVIRRACRSGGRPPGDISLPQ